MLHIPKVVARKDCLQRRRWSIFSATDEPGRVTMQVFCYKEVPPPQYHADIGSHMANSMGRYHIWIAVPNLLHFVHAAVTKKKFCASVEPPR